MPKRTVINEMESGIRTITAAYFRDSTIVPSIWVEDFNDLLDLFDTSVKTGTATSIIDVSIRNDYSFLDDHIQVQLAVSHSYLSTTALDYTIDSILSYPDAVEKPDSYYNAFIYTSIIVTHGEHCLRTNLLQRGMIYPVLN